MAERPLSNTTGTMPGEERIALRQIAAAKEMTVSALSREWRQAYQGKTAKK